MLKDIFYIAKEMCNKCWDQLVKIISEIKINNAEKISNLMFFKYYRKNQINRIASKVIAFVKCDDNFYTLFWKQYLLKADNNVNNKRALKYMHEGVNFTEEIIEDVVFGAQRNNNQETSLKEETNSNILIKNEESTLNRNMTVSSLSIPFSNEKLIQISNVKPKIHHWVWIMAVIAVLLLTSGIGTIGYEMYRRTTHSNLINETFVGDKKNQEKNQNNIGKEEHN